MRPWIKWGVLGFKSLSCEVELGLPAGLKNLVSVAYLYFYLQRMGDCWAEVGKRSPFVVLITLAGKIWKISKIYFLDLLFSRNSL